MVIDLCYATALLPANLYRIRPQPQFSFVNFVAHCDVLKQYNNIKNTNRVHFNERSYKMYILHISANCHHQGTYGHNSNDFHYMPFVVNLAAHFRLLFQNCQIHKLHTTSYNCMTCVIRWKPIGIFFLNVCPYNISYLYIVLYIILGALERNFCNSILLLSSKNIG
jgi:hypothetical protein